mgnify:CR=1 FL=1
MTRFIYFLLIAMLIGCGSDSPKAKLELASKQFEIFKDNTIHFTPSDSSKYETATTWALDNGRVVLSTVEIPRFDQPVRILARLATKPIPKDIQFVYDPWDRAGTVRLVNKDRADVEILKFITAYGGYTEHSIDVSYLAPFLRDGCTIAGFIDTWSSPGWKMDFTLEFQEDPQVINPTWGQALVYEQSFDQESYGEGGIDVEVNIPEGLNQLKLHYLVSGHCTDGMGADEFESKDNVISVDGKEVHRFRPWRDDCLQYRAINPYCRRWSDGSWSSDYSRSGWCPGNPVLPVEIDLSSALSAGDHLINISIDDIRPKNEAGNFGYWRVSAYLLGW